MNSNSMTPASSPSPSPGTSNSASSSSISKPASQTPVNSGGQKRPPIAFRKQVKKSKLEICYSTEEAAILRTKAAAAEEKEARIGAAQKAMDLRVSLGMPMTIDEVQRLFPDVFKFIFEGDV